MPQQQQRPWSFHCTFRTNTSSIPILNNRSISKDTTMQSGSVLLDLTNQLNNTNPDSLSRWKEEHRPDPKTGDRSRNLASSKQRQRRRKQVDMKIWGPWTKYEKLAFLEGLRRFGPGNWKQISTIIETRDIAQVKSHAQYLRKKYTKGEYLFADLDLYYCDNRNTNDMFHFPKAPSVVEYLMYSCPRVPNNNDYYHHHPLSNNITISSNSSSNSSNSSNNSSTISNNHPKVKVRSPSQVLVAACALVQLGTSTEEASSNDDA